MFGPLSTVIAGVACNLSPLGCEHDAQNDITPGLELINESPPVQFFDEIPKIGERPYRGSLFDSKMGKRSKRSSFFYPGYDSEDLPFDNIYSPGMTKKKSGSQKRFFSLNKDYQDDVYDKYFQFLKEAEDTYNSDYIKKLQDEKAMAKQINEDAVSPKFKRWSFNPQLYWKQRPTRKTGLTPIETIEEFEHKYADNPFTNHYDNHALVRRKINDLGNSKKLHTFEDNDPTFFNRGPNVKTTYWNLWNGGKY